MTKYCKLNITCLRTPTGGRLTSWLFTIEHNDAKGGKRKCCLPIRRICKRSNQPKIERLLNNDFRSDMLLIFYMVWPWFSCGTVCVCPQFPYRGNDTIFWIFLIVPCHAFCMWHWPIGKRFGFEFHLRSSPSAYSGFVNINRVAENLYKKSDPVVGMLGY